MAEAYAGFGKTEQIETLSLQAERGGTEFLSFSSVFQKDEKFVSSSSSLASPEQIYKWLKNGTFGFARRQISDAFLSVGGKDSSGRPVNIRGIIQLCLSVSAQGYRYNSVRKHLRIWFDPFFGRIELRSGGGRRDSLTIWEKSASTAV